MDCKLGGGKTVPEKVKFLPSTPSWTRPDPSPLVPNILKNSFKNTKIGTETDCPFVDVPSTGL
jgi:hypothetical protein